MWEIHAIGDAAFLERVLNSVAMLAGTGNLEQVAAIGMLVGLILMGFQSVMDNGSGIKFQNLLISWMLFTFMFGSASRVAVEDVYTGEVRIVDNVPAGVAAAGSMITQIGFGLTELFEQSFGEAAMTENGFAFAIETLANIRKATMSPGALRGANSPTDGADVWESWRNYIADCTLTGVDLGQIKKDQILNGSRSPGAGLMAQLVFDSNSYGTELKLGSSSGFHSCRDGFGVLETYTKTEFVPALERRASVALGRPLGDGAMVVQSALESINQSSISAQDYMLTTALFPILEWAQVDDAVNFHRSASAQMLHTTIQQRAEQWAAEQALFNTVVRPMMTFFEGLVFAITPMMAFLVGLGPMGIKLIGKYLMIILWIQLWMPVLAIINLYMHMAMGKKMAALDNPMNGTPLDSFYGVIAMDMELQNWIATGGMLAASTPAICLMLIYGGAVAASGVASRMGSGNVPTDVSTPSISQNAPLFEMGSMANANRAQGLSTTGAGGYSLSVGRAFSSAESSAQDQAVAAQQNLSKQVSSAISGGLSTGSMSSESLSSAMRQTATNTESFEKSKSVGESLMQGVNTSRSLTAQDLAGLGISAMTGTGSGASLGLKGAGLGGAMEIKNGTQIAGELASKGLIASGQQDSVAKQIDSNRSDAQKHAAGFSDSVARDATSGKQNTFAQTAGLTDNKQFAAAASEARTATERHSQLQALQSNMGIVGSLKDTHLGEMLKNDKDKSSALDSFWNDYASYGLTKESNDWANNISSQNRNMDQDNVRRAAQVFSMADGKWLDQVPEHLRGDAAARASSVLTQIAGVDTPNQLAHGASSGVAGAVGKETQGLRSEVAANTVGANGLNAGAVRSDYNSGVAKQEESMASQTPEGAYASYKGNTQEAGKSMDKEFGKQRKENLVEQVGKAHEGNQDHLKTLRAASGIVGRWTPENIGQIDSWDGFKDTLNDNSNMVRWLSEANLNEGMDRRDFMKMSPEERGEYMGRVRDVISDKLQENNFHPDVANLAAAALAPEAAKQLLSGGMMNRVNDDQMVAAAQEHTNAYAVRASETLQYGIHGQLGDQEATRMAYEDMTNAAMIAAVTSSPEALTSARHISDSTVQAIGYGRNY